jgi:heptosyltransferase-2
LPAIHKATRFVPSPCGTFVLCGQALAAFWRTVPWVSDVVAFDGHRSGWDSTLRLRRLQPGVALVFPNSFGSTGDVYWATRIPVRIGRRGGGRAFMLTHRLPAWRRGQGVGERHQLSHYLEVAGALGSIAWDTEYPPLRVPNAAGTAARLGIEGATAAWLAIAPGAAFGPAKQWPEAGFRAVCEWWLGRGGRVVVVGTGKERQTAERITAGLAGVLDLAGRTSMVELMAVLACVGAVVANDSGAMHLAAGVGTRGVAVFGSTDPVSTGPIGAPWVVVRGVAACAPCFRRTCRPDVEPYHCLGGVLPETVCRAVEFVLGAA